MLAIKGSAADQTDSSRARIAIKAARDSPPFALLSPSHCPFCLEIWALTPAETPSVAQGFARQLYLQCRLACNRNWSSGLW